MLDLVRRRDDHHEVDPLRAAAALTFVAVVGSVLPSLITAGMDPSLPLPRRYAVDRTAGT
jgi:hypothetical protein